MSYDIYGNNLARGHCEVHPWVGEEYPCSLCYEENDKHNKQNKIYNQQEKDYYDAMEREHYDEIIKKNYFKYRILCFIVLILQNSLNRLKIKLEMIYQKEKRKY